MFLTKVTSATVLLLTACVLASGFLPLGVAPATEQPAAGQKEPPQSPDDLPSDAAQRVKEFESEAKAIRTNADAEIKARRDKLIKDLQALQETYTRAGRLAEAVAIRARIRQLSPPGFPGGRPPPVPKGLPAKGGIVKGKITLKGDPPDLKKLTNDLLAEIDRKKDDKEHCLAGKPFEKEQFVWRIGDNKGVGNVFVWLKPEAGKFFEVSDKQVEKLKNHPVIIDQPHGAFIPHCAVYVPRYRDAKGKEQKTGQQLVVKNSAEMSHNTNVGSENEILKPGKETEFTLRLQTGEYEMKCNIHPWMRGYIRTFDHPYATVSLADDKVKPGDASFGTYEIKNTPVGKMRILAWHERAGFLTRPQGDEITIRGDGPTIKDFKIVLIQAGTVKGRLFDKDGMPKRPSYLVNPD